MSVEKNDKQNDDEVEKQNAMFDLMHDLYETEE